MTSVEDICRSDAVSLARRVRQRDLSPTEVVDAVLAQMERLNRNPFIKPKMPKSRRLLFA